MVEPCRIIAVTPPGLCPQNITWTKTELSPVASKSYAATVPAPPTGYRAFFVTVGLAARCPVLTAAGGVSERRRGALPVLHSGRQHGAITSLTRGRS